MSEKTRKLISVAGSALLVSSMGASAGVAFADVVADEPADRIDEVVEGTDLRASQVERVVGAFSYSQEEVTPTEVLAKAMSAAKYLCGSTVAASGETAAADWVVAVTGDVSRVQVGTLEEFAEEGEVHAVMGCSCGGNPADGLASVNAEVKGVSLAYLLEAAGASEDANTLVFTSADGYEVALPMSYVMQRASMIVYSINGRELADSVGGTNQLWLGSTSARYFVRNVVNVSVEERQTPPPVPGTAEAGDTYANIPNIGVQYGGQA